MVEPQLEPIVAGAALPPPGRWALFLDIDGTLLDIAPTPDSVVVPDSLPPTLLALQQRFDGAVALVSGRNIQSIDRIFAPLKLAAAGQHGAEIRRHPNAPVEELIDAGRVLALAERLRPLAAEIPGVLVEEKGLSVAVHFRNAPAAELDVEQAVQDAVTASVGTFEALHGKMVWDVRPRAITKGTAIETLLGAPPFIGRIPVVIGDDRTDEDGFQAAGRQGGVGILVGPLRETAARLRLASPDACRNWLSQTVLQSA